MSRFQESNLNFDFKGARWSVIKYDEHVAHENISNIVKPTKAVDFLGIYNDKKIYFVEVKNYRGHTSDPDTKEILKAGGEELMRRIAVKVRDTIAGATNAARFSTNEKNFFTRINEILLNDAEKVIVIAWIEFDEMNENERKTKMSVWQQKLKHKLSWLHAAKISINSINTANEILPETDISFT